mgnify:CR=1 FL=1
MDLASPFLSRLFGNIFDCIVCMRVAQNCILGFESHAVEYGIDSRGRIGDKYQVFDIWS